jgi:hypothetical protein
MLVLFASLYAAQKPVQSSRVVVRVSTTFSVMGTEAALTKATPQILRKVCGLKAEGETV